MKSKIFLKFFLSTRIFPEFFPNIFQAEEPLCCEIVTFLLQEQAKGDLRIVRSEKRRNVSQDAGKIFGFTSSALYSSLPSNRKPQKPKRIQKEAK